MSIHSLIMCWLFLLTNIFFQVHIESRSILGNYDYPTENETDMRIADHEHAYVAVCLIVKDQNKDLREWILYHQYIGIQKFYIFDDFSNPPALLVIHDFVQQGLVSYFYLGAMYEGRDFYISRGYSQQTYSYNVCLKWFQHKHTFMGFIDADEFVVLRDEENNIHNRFVPFLQQYEDYGGVVLYWRLFGSSGLRNRQYSTLLSYTACEPSNDTDKYKPPHKSLYKSFLNVRYSLGECGPHLCDANVSTVNTEFEDISHNPQTFGTWNKAFIHHYRIKSWQDYQERMERGSAHNPKHARRRAYNAKYFEELDNQTTAFCPYMKEIAENCCKDLNPPYQINY
eukprot:TRINITY_DN2621_c0_g1_i1.p1 TRINITY_DN2621_c0_g1~~TRINITY_DN2621_c0_g1_i1.p1  ORF type:complete len:340 (+),score=1.35 TRINITY_DN2621_c0_g1_i1:56-1075(+)